MSEWLDIAVQFSVIAGFVGGIFSYVILRPLNNSIQELRHSIDRLTDKYEKSEERLRVIEVRLAELEQLIQVAHHRVDVLNDHFQVREANM